MGGFRDILRILPARERRGDAAQRQHAEPAPTAPDGGVPLAEALLTLIEMLSNAIEGEAAYPRRPELRERFKAIEDAARLLRHEWLDQRIRALLLDGDVRIENENEMFHGLRDIAARAARERERNSPKQGRGKLYPKASWPTPMELCALMVAVAHCHLLGRWPGKSNVKVQQCCEALWQAAGGPRRAGWGEPGSVAVWRHHLKAAQKYRPPHQAGIRIQLILAPDIRRRPVRVTGSPSRSLYDHPSWRALIKKEGGRKKTK